MRLTILVAAAAIAMPTALIAHPASAPGLTAAQAATDLSAAKKKKKPAKKKEENLKAAPSAPSTKDKSTY
jgi:hypothetical protein